MDDIEYNPESDDEQVDDNSVEIDNKDVKNEDDDDFDMSDNDVSDDEFDEDLDDNDGSVISEHELNSRIQSNTDIGFDTDDDDKDDDNYEDYLQKFDESTRKEIISEYHPEMQSHNYNEIVNLAVIVKDANGIPIDPLHKTLPMLTRYEKARILGERTKQINSGAKPFVKVDETIVDGYLIALKELEEKKIPFIIKRPMPNGGCEYWKLSDLEILV